MLYEVITDHQIAVARGQLLPEAFLTGEAQHSRDLSNSDNDSASTVTRMLDIGVEPYLVSSSLLLVVRNNFV